MHKGMFYHESIQVYAHLYSTLPLLFNQMNQFMLTAVSVTGGILEPA